MLVSLFGSPRDKTHVVPQSAFLKEHPRWTLRALNAAFVRGVQPRNRTQEGGFSRSIRPDQSDALSSVKLTRESLHEGALPRSEGQIVENQRGP